MKWIKSLVLFFFFLSTSGAWAVTADQVVDRESLKEFVPKAAAHLEADYDQALKDFNEDDGDWKSEDIYLYILDFQGHSVFHAFMPELQGENLINLTDSNGVKIVRELIRVASSVEKGGYVEYIWSNPILEGGSSSKVGYAQRFIGPNGEDLIVGSGLYLLENILCPDPDQYLNPVCGGQKTYSNICEMYKDQATFSYYGLCPMGGGVCPAVHEPVCGQPLDPTLPPKTYSNTCFMHADWSTLVSMGECPSFDVSRLRVW